jgi:tetratricopeptide (TPR) repeat protein
MFLSLLCLGCLYGQTAAKPLSQAQIKTRYLQALRLFNQAERVRESRKYNTNTEERQNQTAQIKNKCIESLNIVSNILTSQFRPRYALLYLRNKSFLGTDILNNETCQQYIKWIEETGDAETCYDLYFFLANEIYNYGSVDHTVAARWFHKAISVLPSAAYLSYYYLGEIYYRGGQHRTSLKFLTNFLNMPRHNDNPYLAHQARLYAADILWDNTNHDRAVDLYQTIKDDPMVNDTSKYTALERLAEYSMEQVDFKSAFDVFSQLNEVFPSRYFALQKHIYSFLAGNEPKLSELQKLSPENQGSRLFLEGIAKYCAGEYPAAINTFEICSSYRGYYHISLFAAERCIRKLGNINELILIMRQISLFFENSDMYGRAISSYENLLKDCTPVYTNYFYLGNLYRKLKQHAQAERIFSRLPLNPGVSSAELFEASLYLEKRKNYKNALVLMDILINRNPENLSYHYQRGELHAAITNFTKACADYSAAARIAPWERDVLFQLAIAQIKSGDLCASEKTFTRIFKSFPTFAEPYNYLGYTYVEHQTNLEKAEQLLEKALALKPACHEFIDSWAWLKFHQRQYNDAARSIAQAISLMEKENEIDGIIYDHAGHIFKASGNEDLSRKYTQLAREFPATHEEKSPADKEN